MSFWVIDAEPSETGALLYTVTGDGVLEEMRASIKYKGYIQPSRAISSEAVAADLEESGLALRAWVEKWKLPPYYRDEASITVYTVDSIENYKKINSITLRKHIGRIVNDYPDPLVEALWSAGYHPLYKLEIHKGKPVIVEDPRRLDYEDPPLNVAQVNRDPYTGKYRVQLSNTTIHTVDECSVIQALEDHQANVILATIGTRHRIQGFCTKSRHIKALWIDADSMLTGMHGLVEWARLARLPLKQAARSSIGRILTTIEAFEARKKKYLAVRNHGRVEPIRSIIELAEYDRGGAIYTPRPGLYTGIVQVDYNSLYPSIISRYNISGETVDDPHCGRSITPPGTSHKVCIERRGIVPGVMDKLIPRKEGYKALQETLGDPSYNKVLEERRSAVKWILVASFGYLGYRNSLFGSIMAHETVTGASRSIMAESKRVVESMGYRVIHILVDSLFIQAARTGGTGECEMIAGEVSRVTGFKARCEAVYKWLLIPRTDHGSGAANKYFGLLHNGEVKTKGILAVRRDTPPLVRELQLRLIGIMAKHTAESMSEACSELRSVYSEYVDRIINGAVNPSSLVVRRKIEKPSWGFNRRILQASKAKTGGLTEYIVAPHGSPVDPAGFNGRLDRRFYLRMLARGYNEVAGEICGYQPLRPGW